MSLSPEVYPIRVYNNAPVDDLKRPYWPDWAGDQMQLWMRLPQMRVSLLLHQEPTPQRARNQREIPNHGQASSSLHSV